MKTKALSAARRVSASRARERSGGSHRTALRQGYVVGAATGDATGNRRDGRDVTGAGNDCPPHSYGYILSL